MKKVIIYVAAVLNFCNATAQQHPAKKDTSMKGMDMGDMKMDPSGSMMSMKMNSQYSLDLPMNRDGSGTSWVPDETPMYAYMIHGKKWMTMIHGSIFLRYNNQDLFKSGSRGGSKVDAPNWLMAMKKRQIGKKGFRYCPFSRIPRRAGLRTARVYAPFISYE